MIQITYFGRFKTILNITTENLAWSCGTSVDLLNLLKGRDELWRTTLSEDQVFRVVVNNEICYEETAIKVGDHVALLPPVTGG
ncbi:hypothetical protein AwWohl_07910 [Gammaproteobacteria bacterium]|nr:hypothetical protein AwWohl_07910 [Gammaproteobacteria bacterium]